ncbi:MAG: adenylosuccinate lyase [Deltaproteobacteria bacterium]|nr:adenylosuccinate lyase [Deltaproteobacteria bacterium]
MIPRYTPDELSRLWSPGHRYATWLAVELAACRAMERAGVVPGGTADVVAAKMGDLLERDPGAADEIDRIERTTRHDVIAFLTFVERTVGPEARWLHRGMTSSDVLDSSLAILLREAIDLCMVRHERLLAALAARAREHARTPMIGRSHGIHAEPITFGLALAGHHAELARGLSRLRAARDEIAVGKIAGAVGTYAHLSPAIEADALGSLGLRAETVSTQIVSRDRHATYFAALAGVAGAIERLATNVRHWQRTEVGEAREAFGTGQKGSSAMPHKKNPILSENLCGLARLVRTYAMAAFEDTALWHERDISHSSVERVIGPDATATLAFMIERATALVEGLVVDSERLYRNLESSRGLWASEAVLLLLVDRGVGRQEGYEMVQKHALRAYASGEPLLDLVASDPEICARVPAEELRAAGSLDHALRHVDAILERALGPASSLSPSAAPAGERI